MAANIIAVAASVLTLAVVFSPRFRRSVAWRATVTPLASIIGSGFLVSLPLLAGEVGVFAFFAMMLLVGASFLLGGAIRFNIRHGEPMFDEEDAHGLITSAERMSHLALAFAYFISVAYYLSLLSAFLLKPLGITSHAEARLVTSGLLVFIGFYGFIRGLRGLELIEEYAVGLKLAVIAAVLAGLVWFNMELAVSGNWNLAAREPEFTWHTAQLVLGLLIVVQGFETSRFLKGSYPPELRIRTMRNAQLISAAIYAAFFALSTVLIGSGGLSGDVAAVTDMVGGVALVLPLMLTAGAVFAQMSAAIADAIGSAGLIQQFGEKIIERRHAYPFIATVGLIVVWQTNVFGVIALASRAFAVFYFIQCIVAAMVAMHAPGVEHRRARMAGFFALAVVALAVIVFGVPAEIE